MTSFIAAGGSGRSTSVIPAVPAAWSVTTIAFIWDTSPYQSSPAALFPLPDGSYVTSTAKPTGAPPSSSERGADAAKFLVVHDEGSGGVQKCGGSSSRRSITVMRGRSDYPQSMGHFASAGCLAVDVRG